MRGRTQNDYFIDFVLACLVLALFCAILILPATLLSSTVSRTTVANITAGIFAAYVVGLYFCITKWRRRGLMPFVILISGLLTMIAAMQEPDLNVPWDVSFFAAGVTLVALGFTLLSMVSRREDKVATEKSENGDRGDDAKHDKNDDARIGTIGAKQAYLAAGILALTLVALCMLKSRKTQRWKRRPL
jgi:hypothetical protein